MAWWPCELKAQFLWRVSAGKLGEWGDALDERCDTTAPDGVIVFGEDDEFCEGVLNLFCSVPL